MKIRFYNNQFTDELDEYPIFSIHYQVVDGQPIDITITGYEEMLEKIAALHGRLGFNIKEFDGEGCLTWAQRKYAEEHMVTHEALYGRLDSFEVVDAYNVTMICDYNQ